MQKSLRPANCKIEVASLSPTKNKIFIFIFKKTKQAKDKNPKETMFWFKSCRKSILKGEKYWLTFSDNWSIISSIAFNSEFATHSEGNGGYISNIVKVYFDHYWLILSFLLTHFPHLTMQWKQAMSYELRAVWIFFLNISIFKANNWRGGKEEENGISIKKKLIWIWINSCNIWICE